jgi:hypothetical protein
MAVTFTKPYARSMNRFLGYTNLFFCGQKQGATLDLVPTSVGSKRALNLDYFDTVAYATYGRVDAIA